MMAFFNEIKYAFRQLGRNPSFTVVAVLTLAIGIGACTAMFSVVNGALLRPLAFPGSDRLVYIREIVPAVAEKYPTLPVSANHFSEWRQRCTSFESLSLVSPDAMNLTGRDEPERLEAMLVSANLFDMLKVQPAIGRTFVTGEDQSGQDHVVIISYGLWQRKFNGDPALVGSTITLDSEPYTVIGVLSTGFRFPKTRARALDMGERTLQPDIFKPKVLNQQELNEHMGQFNYGVIGRLKSDVTPAQATAELNVIAANIVKEAGINMDLRAAVTPWRDWIVGNSRKGLWVLLAAITSVLLIACLNLAILCLVRAEKRSFDSAIRTALGASKIRLLRQVLIEILLIAFMSGVLGVLTATLILDALIRMAPAEIPRLDEVHLDGYVLLFAVVLTGVTALLFGVLPAWRMAQSHPREVLAAGARSATTAKGGLRVRSALVTAEVGLGVVLLVLAGLLLSSFSRVLRADKGFDAPAVLATDIVLPWARYGGQTQRANFYQALLTRLESTPSVTSAAIISALPLQGETWVDVAYLPGDTRPMIEKPTVNVRFISRAYFQTMGIPLLAGRTFNDSDRSRKAAVISERLARILWPKQDSVIGYPFLNDNKEEFEVIGVVGDVRANADGQSVALMYRSYWDTSRPQVVIVARAAGNPFSIAGSVRGAVHELDADLPVSRMRTMREILDDSVAQRRFQMILASAFAGTALLLAGLGIYGVLSFLVTQRTREMGIRMAFGACQRDVLCIILRQGMIPVVIGIATGVVGALALGRVLASLLYEVSPHDPLTMLAVVGVLVIVAFTACLIPARRAAKIDPMEALRYE
ncbi:MAG: ABC transporter permease [Sedimentisphaerales bacterium]